MAPNGRRHRRRWSWLLVRELAPAILPLVGIPLLVVFFVASPVSPWALHRADARMATGGVIEAVSAYEQVARRSMWPGHRREATWRAASLANDGQVDPQEARRLYRTFLKSWPDDPRISQARVALARIEWQDFRQPDRAARQYTWAVLASPAAPEASDWLQRAGDAWLAAGRTDQARSAWRRVIADYPTGVLGARLAMARLALFEGDPDRAFEHFQEVAVAQARGTEATLARLGMSLCREQLGDLDAALAELDVVADELPYEVLQQRRERLIERQRKVRGETR